MPRTFQFIEVEPSHIDTTRARRTIRSHAARAGNNTDYAKAAKVTNQGKKKAKTVVWPLLLDLSSPPSHIADGTAEEGADATEGPEVADKASQPIEHEHEKEHILTPFAGLDVILPISQSKLYRLPFLSLVVTNYLTNLAVAIPEIDGPSDSGLLKKSWFPMVLHSTVLFQIIVLFSASHYASHQEGTFYAHDILHIKQCALADLQKTLNNAGGPNRDENIAAVGKLASYEAIFGSEKSYHVHMEGLTQMLKHRGGLGKLGMDGFLARLLVFIDTNSAFLLNTRLHLDESNFPRIEPWVPPNPSKFIGSS